MRTTKTVLAGIGLMGLVPAVIVPILALLRVSREAYMEASVFLALASIVAYSILIVPRKLEKTKTVLAGVGFTGVVVTIVAAILVLLDVGPAWKAAGLPLTLGSIFLYFKLVGPYLERNDG